MEYYYLQWLYGVTGKVSDSCYLKLDGNYDEVGTVSETEIDFDCEGLLNCKQFTGKHHLRLLLIEKGITPTPETKIVILKKI